MKWPLLLLPDVNFGFIKLKFKKNKEKKGKIISKQTNTNAKPDKKALS